MIANPKASPWQSSLARLFGCLNLPRLGSIFSCFHRFCWQKQVVIIISHMGFCVLIKLMFSHHPRNDLRLGSSTTNIKRNKPERRISWENLFWKTLIFGVPKQNPKVMECITGGCRQMVFLCLAKMSLDGLEAGVLNHLQYHKCPQAIAELLAIPWLSHRHWLQNCSSWYP